MEHAPSVTIYEHEGRRQVYAFVVDPNGNLRVNFFDTAPGITSWRWDNWSVRRPPANPPTALSHSPSAITSIQDFGVPERYQHAFVRGTNGRLYQHYWAPSARDPLGPGWNWEDIGTPPAQLIGSPGTVSYRKEPFRIDDDNTLAFTYDCIAVFMRDDDGNLWRASWFQRNLGDPYRWEWFPHGSPGRIVVSRPGVIAYRHPRYVNNARLRVYAFVVDDQGNLQVTHTDNSDPLSGSGWQTIGNPGFQLTGRPAVLKFWEQFEFMFIFVMGVNGRLSMCVWDGFTGPVWADLGPPLPYFEQGNLVFPLVTSEPAVNSFTHGGMRRFYVFVRGNDDFLHVWFGTRSGRWAGPDERQLGKPPGGVNLAGAPEVIPFSFEWDGTDRNYVFIHGQDNRLKLCHWNGVDSWDWRDQGLG